MTTLYIDFETRSRVDLISTGPYVYAEDPSTEVTVVCWAVDDGPVGRWLLGDGAPPADVVQAVRDGWRIVAHNAIAFERVVWKHVLTARHRWPEPLLSQWDCTMARAMALGLPRSLDQLGRALGIDHPKDAAGHRLMLKLCRPAGDGSWHWSPEDAARLADYCARDVEAERDIDRILPPLQALNRATFELDAIINARGVQIDGDLVDAASDVVSSATDLLDRRMQLITGGAVSRCSQASRLISWCAGQGVQIASLAKADLAGILEMHLPQSVRYALELRRDAAKSSTAKYEAYTSRTSRDGRMRDNLLWHGAHTGRWAGKGAQLQNLPRGVMDADEAIDLILSRADAITIDATTGAGALGTASSSLRGCIVAGPGRDLIAADYASIEARGLAWLVGHDELVDQFAAGADVYKWMAGQIYGKPAAAVEKAERHLGKTAILGCGYGMGKDKFFSTCQLAGLSIDRKLSDKAVDMYRAANKPIADGWRDLSRAAETAIRTPKHRTEVFGGRIAFVHDGTHLWMRLPSGRRLCYWRASMVHNDDTLRDEITYWGVQAVTRKWAQERTWGGKLMENAVQALCRDVMAEAMLRAEAAGYDVVLTVHDEIVSEVPAAFGSVEEFCAILTEVPAWAGGFPISAEGWRGGRYRK